jgi:hypothetical protein
MLNRAYTGLSLATASGCNGSVCIVPLNTLQTDFEGWMGNRMNPFNTSELICILFQPKRDIMPDICDSHLLYEHYKQNKLLLCYCIHNSDAQPDCR